MPFSDEYQKVAHLYDALTARFLRGPRRKILLFCRASKVERVLDVGCGTGILAGMLAKRAVLVAGMEASPAMLRMAVQNAEARQGSLNSGPYFVLADARRPPFKPSSFDLTVISLMLHECLDPEAVLRETLALAPRVLVLEWRMPERNLDLVLTAWVHVVERLAGKRHYAAFRRFMQGGGIRGLAARAGARILSERALAGNSLVLAELTTHI